VASPEATTTEVHVYTAAELNTPDGAAKVLDSFKDIGTKDSTEISGAVLEMENQGILVRDTSENPKVDSIFGGAELKVNGGSPELSSFLSSLRKDIAVQKSLEFHAQLASSFDRAADKGLSVGLATAQEAAEAYRTGQIDLQSKPPVRGQKREVTTVTNSTNVLATAKGEMLKDFVSNLDPAEQEKYKAYLANTITQLANDRRARDSEVATQLKVDAAAQRQADEAQKVMANWNQYYERAKDVLKSQRPDDLKAYEKRVEDAKTTKDKAARTQEMNDYAAFYLEAQVAATTAAAEARNIEMKEQARQAVADLHAASEKAVTDQAGEAQRKADAKAAGTLLTGSKAAQQAQIDAIMANAKSEDAARMGDTEFKARVEARQQLNKAYETRITAAANDRQRAELTAMRDTEIDEALAKLASEYVKPKTQAEINAETAEDKAGEARQEAEAKAAGTLLTGDKATQDAQMQAMIQSARIEDITRMHDDPELKARVDAKRELNKSYKTRIDNAPNERQRNELIAMRDTEISEALDKLESEYVKPKTHAELVIEAAAKAKADQEALDATARLARLDATNRMPDRATDPGGYEAAITKAQEEAISEMGYVDSTGNRVRGDRFAREQVELYQRHQEMIDALPLGTDPSIKAEMIKQQNQDVARLRTTQIEIQRDGIQIASQVREKNARGESFVTRLDATDAQAEAKAIARHKQLNLDPLPFLERKAGGRLHWSKERRQGAKVTESFFRDPSNPNLVVVERRLRKNAKLVSQSVITTERGIRQRGDLFLPPKEVFDTLRDIRLTDTKSYKSAGRESSVQGSLDGSGGVYSQYGASSGDLDKRKAVGNTAQKRGGVLYWLFGR
jgi:hypothetical protein